MYFKFNLILVKSDLKKAQEYRKNIESGGRDQRKEEEQAEPLI